MTKKLYLPLLMAMVVALFSSCSNFKSFKRKPNDLLCCVTTVVHSVISPFSAVFVPLFRYAQGFLP